MDISHCCRCHQPAYETNDEGFCANCWTPAEVTEVLMDLALDYALSRDTEKAIEEVHGHLGREPSADERAELIVLIADVLSLSEPVA